MKEIESKLLSIIRESSQPAILGGRPVLSRPLRQTYNIGREEKRSVLRVLESGNLSGFLGRAGNGFLGGKEVLEFEKSFKKRFGVEYAISFNSATTALDAAVCSLDISPGDEVIVSPYTMSASATSILMNNGIPVFADIEPDTFCLDPKSIRERITDRTKAVMVTNIFGGSARYEEILQIVRERNLRLIEDNAQAPGGLYHGRELGTIGDAGVFSLNRHKTMQTGEGGVLVTNNGKLAYRAQLKRNHGEAVLDDLKDKSEFVVGSNYRFTEVNAAIAKEQLKKLDWLNKARTELADHLSERLESIAGISPVFVLPDTEHVYYLYPIKYDEKEIGLSRERFVKAMVAEGFALNSGYLKPLHLLPLFQSQQTGKNSHFPFDFSPNKQDYSRGICPTAERMYDSELILTDICRYPLRKKDIDLFARAIGKVLDNREKLRRVQT